MFHIQPFGYSEIHPDSDEHYQFLPQYDNEGELYIGIERLQPPQNLSLLFQMAEGSADPDLEPETVHWSYLSGNRWIGLEHGNVLFDTTRGLINSGIIEFALEPAQPSTVLPDDQYWLRAAIARHSNSVCDTVAIHAQAVLATFVYRDSAADHSGRPLSAGSITRLLNPVPEIKAIHQPYTSFGGKSAEQDSTFYTRVSERLRHKHRALTSWDFEHMILAQFPQVYKAKCLPATVSDDLDEPGGLEIVIIPDVRNRVPFDPFEPKAPADLIADIDAYLADKTPAYAAIKVKNAHYISVWLKFGVRFLPGHDEGYLKQSLNDELNRFLSPWAYEEGADIVIGGRIYANSIINFIEERPYVDYVARFKLFRSEDEQGYWVDAGRADGVLVAARRHVIDIIPETGYEEEWFTGIGYMQIGWDFFVS
jgi:hypothetical protein